MTSSETRLSRFRDDRFTASMNYALEFFTEHKENVRRFLFEMLEPETLVKLTMHSMPLILRYNERIAKVPPQYNMIICKCYEKLITLFKSDGCPGREVLWEGLEAWFGVLQQHKESGGRDTTHETVHSLFMTLESRTEQTDDFAESLLGPKYDDGRMRRFFLPHWLLFFVRLFDIYDRSLEGRTPEQRQELLREELRTKQQAQAEPKENSSSVAEKPQNVEQKTGDGEEAKSTTAKTETTPAAESPGQSGTASEERLKSINQSDSIDDERFALSPTELDGYLQPYSRKWWDSRYSKHPEVYEHVQTYEGLTDILRRVLPQPRMSGPARELLYAGCGTSDLAHDIWASEGGTTNPTREWKVTTIDWSRVLVKALLSKERTAETDANGQSIGVYSPTIKLMDARHLVFEEYSFDAVIDKGLIDSLIEFSSLNEAKRVSEHVCRVLKMGGVFVCVSRASPMERYNAFDGYGLPWSVAVFEYAGAGTDFMDGEEFETCFVYVMRRHSDNEDLESKITNTIAKHNC